MANLEQLVKIKAGVIAWNSWREKDLSVEIDLSGANLSGANLSGANLGDANLRSANLSGANLKGANLRGASLNNANLLAAHLIETNLNNADLTDANLHTASLYFADLRHASLGGADLGAADLGAADLDGANLNGADLNSANLRSANLRSTDLSNTNFAGVNLGLSSLSDVDLSVVRGLAAVRHLGPSTIGLDTLYKSKGKIPESFLRGCGVPQEFIDYIPSHFGTLEPIQYYSVFISHSSKDHAFAELLYADLQNKKVRCWFAPEDLKIGDKFRVRIDEVIRVYDKLLVVFSEDSVGSDWVEKEVESAMEKERQQKRTMLFPIRLDDAVMKIETGWPADVRRTRHIGDFTNWKDHDAYQKAFDRLMRDLKADEKKTV
jgi:hypothetical protein